MASICPNCSRILSPSARLCTACGFNLQTGRKTVMLVEHAPPRERRWLKILRTPWLQLPIPTLVLLLGRAISATLSDTRRKEFDWRFFCFFVIYGGALVILAAVKSYQHTRNDDVGFFRVRGFIPALLYSGLGIQLHILGYVIAIWIGGKIA